MPKLLAVKPSSDPEKKLDVVLEGESGREKTVRIGAKGMSDFTHHHDLERKERYLRRHEAREDWKLSGALTSGFWSRWLLWNKPSLKESKRDVLSKFPSLRK